MPDPHLPAPAAGGLATPSARATCSPAAADGDLGTVWPSRRLDQAEAGQLVLDLGAPRPVARLIVWPTASVDVLVPLEVARARSTGSLGNVSGVTPTEVRASSRYIVGPRPLFRPRNGWLELVMTPRPVRCLRIRPLEAELGRRRDGGRALRVRGRRSARRGTTGSAISRRSSAPLRGRGVTRLLADPVVSARIAMATRGAIATLPANGVLNSHGLAPPMQLYARFRLRETDAFVVPAEDAPDLRERLAASGLRVTSEALGPYVLVQPAGPRPRRRVAGPLTGG